MTTTDNSFRNSYARRAAFSPMHPEAEDAAEIAEFAGTQGRFWEMHDAIFENQETLGPDLFLALAKKLGLSEKALDSALASGEFTPRVKSDFIGGVRSGVNGTPTFFINGHRHEGSFEFEDLVAAIENQLRGE